MGLTEPQRERYARQLSLPEIGVKGQEKLAAGRVVLVGLGGLGSAAGYYLAAAGVGTLGLVDDDVVALSNLQRQILHRSADLGRPKVESAAEALRALNPDLQVLPLRLRLTPDNATTILRDCDFVIDATDTFASKFLIADACQALAKPYSHGGINRFLGQTMTVLPGRTACYRCLFPQPLPEAPDATPVGPLGTVPGIIGCIQATEAVKFLLGVGELVTDRMLTCDALRLVFRSVPVTRNPGCPLCA
jgi:molybdopterin/thiamine biosynthesis adenylyltransferase